MTATSSSAPVGHRIGSASAAAARVLPAAMLLAGPTALAFAKGGYFPEARWWAGAVAWGFVALAALFGRTPLPQSRGGRLAVGGLVGLAVWTGLGLLWAPLSIPAVASLQRDVVYVGTLIAAAGWLRGGVGPWVEPAICAGALAALAYGLAERWLPGLVQLPRSTAAAGRLNQPYTYWNAMGALAAIGLVLALRLMSDKRSSRAMAAAAAATPPLALGLWLTFSRGALVAALAGFAALVLLVPVRRQVWAGAVVLLAGAPMVIAAQVLPGVADLDGAISARESSGAVLIAVTVLTAVLVAGISSRLHQRDDGDRVLRPRWRRVVLGMAIVGVTGLVVAVVAADKRPRASGYGATASRLRTADSLRYEYWRVAFDEWRDNPVRGDGAGAFQVAWLKERRVDDTVHQTHSLYLQTLAELGLVGLALLAAFLAGLVAVARRARRLAPTASSGPIAGLVVFFLHAGLDWDWEMPALTLVALVLAGALVGLAEGKLSTDPWAQQAQAGTGPSGEHRV